MSTPPRLRADGVKNKARIIAEAQRLFSTAEAKVSLEAIARAAGVGIGTLYRHFPTKEALVGAVYRSELDALDREADDLLSNRPPAEAMRRWMDSYAKFVVAKHAMHDALLIALAPRSTEGSEIRTRINATIAKFLSAGLSDGSIRGDFRPDDVTVLLAGSVFPAALSADREQIARVLDLLMAGLRPTVHEASH
ncbi:MAG: TetR/AcrR family transcriptional regulator [Pseudolabrys sp.]